ncbi:fluoride efflux transporter CrcB [Longitalea luteola]|uniref:fluoride efflux transporter CrcB n=1 Tax=Longitalea luteola TaxID=2812563 RepID=UPI001A971FA1|nr:fluoride efflux transporter CrcB [Longitalea luteola]
MLWKNILLVGLGGSLGSIARFLCQKYIYAWHPHPFPFGTMIVNIAGCFIIGLLCALADKGNLFTPAWRILLTTGFCGGFTTFSTFAYENISLLRNGDIMYFMLYTAASVILGLLATWLGMLLVGA